MVAWFDLLRYTYLLLRTNKGRFSNAIAILTKRGKLVFPNGFVIAVNKDNFSDVLKLFIFSLNYGVNIGGSWKYDEKANIIITPDGIRFLLKSFDPLIFAETFLYDTHFVDYNLENKIVVHAGAYVGETALYYAKRGAYVYAFEPQPDCYNTAMINLKLNPDLSNRIVLRNWAIGNDGEIEFPNTKCHGGASYFGEYKDRVTVRSVSISTILREFNISEPYVLDLDIKGNEFQVIEDEALGKFSIVRIEYNAIIYGKKLGDVNYLIKKLRDYGFTKIRIYKHNEFAYDLSVHGTIVARK